MPNFDGTGPRENPMSDRGIGAQMGFKRGVNKAENFNPVIESLQTIFPFLDPNEPKGKEALALIEKIISPWKPSLGKKKEDLTMARLGRERAARKLQ